MDRDLGVQNKSVDSAGEGSKLLSPRWHFQKAWGPGPELQGSYYAQEGLWRHSCVRIILLTLAVTISMQPRFLGLLSTQMSHPPESPDQAQEKVLKGSQQKSTDTVWTEAQGHAMEDSCELDIALYIP